MTYNKRIFVWKFNTKDILNWFLLLSLGSIITTNDKLWTDYVETTIYDYV